MSELPAGWKVSSLSNVCGKIMDGSHIPPKPALTGFPMLSARNIKNRQIIFDEYRLINKDDFEREHARTNISPGDILLTIVGAIGRTAVVPIDVKPFTLQRSVAILKPNLTDSRFLSYALESPDLQKFLNDNAKGTAQKGIYLKALSQVHIPLAPLQEQKRIADKLDSLLARVDLCQSHLERIPQILKRFRQSVLDFAMSGFLTEEWRNKKGEALEDWQEKRGEDVFTFITSGSRGWAKYYSDIGAKFIRIGNLDHDTIELDLDEIQHVNPPDNAEGKRTKIYPGDILISITADVGMIGLVRKDIGEAYINQHICLARQTGEYVGEFLAYFLASPSGGTRQFIEAQRGMTKAGLTLGNIRNLKFRIPKKEEQHEIARRVERLFAYANRLEARWQAGQDSVEELTLSLLAKAFRGELVEQDPNDEPASVLLERIKATKEVATKKKKTRRPTMESIKPPKGKRISVVQVLQESGEELSAEQLFLATGFPPDADSELVEEFLVEIRDALENASIHKRRFDNKDWFSLNQSQ